MCAKSWLSEWSIIGLEKSVESKTKPAKPLQCRDRDKRDEKIDERCVVVESLMMMVMKERWWVG
jgi:hypothetical protein